VRCRSPPSTYYAPFLEPLVEDAQRLVAGGRGTGRPPGEQLADVVLEVGLGRRGEALALGLEGGLRPGEVAEVVGDGRAGPVAGAQVPLEGADQGVSGGVHGREARRSTMVSTVK
jgi:hypothetical protein